MRDLCTVSEIAARLGVPRHKVEYVLDARPIEPAARVGAYRLFDRRAVERVGDELSRIARRRDGQRTTRSA